MLKKLFKSVIFHLYFAYKALTTLHWSNRD
jgi:hypothetical protein